MKNFLLLSGLCASISATAQITSSCVVPSDLRNAYKWDVADLAAKRLIDNNSPDRTRIGIPQVHTDSIWGAFAGVLNTGAVLEADSVFRHHCIHLHHRLFAQDSIYVRIDTSMGWTHAWLNGQSASSNPLLDDLLNRYSISVDSIDVIPGVGYDAKLRILTPLNGPALKDSLLTFQGIIGATFQPPFGDGDWIYYDVDSVRRLTFQRGWGDCPISCTEYVKWKYSVSFECVVRLTQKIETIFDDWPTLRGCNLRPLQSQPVESSRSVIYPNPFSDRVVIERPEGQVYRYSLSNILGKSMTKGQAKGPVILHTDNLLNGWYLLRIELENGHLEQRKVFKASSH